MNLKQALTGRRVLFLALGALALAAGAFLLLRGGGARVAYVTEKAARGDISATVTASGTINPVVTVTVGTPVSGIIKSLSADYNTRVKKGQVIAQIDPAGYRAQLEQSRGAYLAARANLDKARVTLADAERTAARYKALVKDGSVAVSDYDTYATAAASARAAVGSAEGSLAQSRGAHDQARTNLDYATIVSPVDGIVISRSVEVGQTVAASLQAPTLFTIAQDLTKMQIYATVDESDIGKVHEGAEAAFSVDDYPDTRFTGVVTQVRNAATTVSNVVTYTVLVGVDNAELKLKPGMTANVTFTAASRRDVLKIPNAALRYRPANQENAAAKAAPGQKRVWVLRDGRPEPVLVSLGIGSDRESEVVSGGLSEGMELITGERGAAKAATANPMTRASGSGMGPPPR